MDPQKKERRQELLHYQREGMRLATAFKKLSHDLVNLVRGDKEACEEVMVGYCSVMAEEMSAEHSEIVVRAVCHEIFLKDSEMADRIVARVICRKGVGHAER